MRNLPLAFPETKHVCIYLSNRKIDANVMENLKIISEKQITHNERNISNGRKTKIS